MFPKDISLLIEEYAPYIKTVEKYNIQTHFALEYIEFQKKKNICKVCEKYFFIWKMWNTYDILCPLYKNKKLEHIHM
jgi:hypothetical protein